MAMRDKQSSLPLHTQRRECVGTSDRLHGEPSNSTGSHMSGSLATPPPKPDVNVAANSGDVLPRLTAKHLAQLLRRREQLQEQLEAMHVAVYDLEKDYLSACMELGGSLFDGFGLTAPLTGSANGAFLYSRAKKSFAPSERLFTASSIGALAIVERHKKMEELNRKRKRPATSAE